MSGRQLWIAGSHPEDGLVRNRPGLAGAHYLAPTRLSVAREEDA